MCSYIKVLTSEAELGLKNSALVSAVSTWRKISPVFNKLYSFAGLDADSHRLFDASYFGLFNRIVYDMDGYHPSCFENFYINLKEYGISQDDIPTAFNIFMNVRFSQDGIIKVIKPTTNPGDYICFKAKMELIVALTACTAKDSNGGTFEPIGYEII